MEHNKPLTLTKEQIKDIKFYLSQEVKKHEFGSWDKFYITSLELRTNGDYSFRVRWALCDDNFEFDDNYKGNLFKDFPIKAVLDGLDAVELLLYPIHIKAQERLIEHSQKVIEQFNESNDYIKRHYNI